MHAKSVDEQSTKSSVTRGSRKHYQTQLTLHKLERHEKLQVHCTGRTNLLMKKSIVI